MNESEFDSAIRFLSRARNECSQQELTDLAKRCDDAIGLFQEVTIVLGLFSSAKGN